VLDGGVSSRKREGKVIDDSLRGRAGEGLNVQVRPLSSGKVGYLLRLDVCRSRKTRLKGGA